MIVVDASALIAIAHREPDRRRYQRALEQADAAYLSPINYVETGIVLSRRGLVASQDELDEWLASFRVIRGDALDLSIPALRAYLQYGKGYHPARLNLADCFAYALAKQLDAPLLYKGDDFSKTDIRSAL